MSKAKVALWKQPRGYATVENGATVGAVLGQNLFYPSGALVKVEDFQTSPANATGKTLWSMIASIPAPVQALAGVSGTGVFVVTGTGTGVLGDTDDVTEGSTNKYYTDERAQDAVAAMFAAGTQTGITFTYNDASNSMSATVSGGGGGGAMTLLGTATVTGSAASQLTISSLSLSSYKSFFVTFALKNATGSASNISIYYNSDTTAANYAAEGCTYSTTTVSASRVSSGIVDSLPASETLTGEFRVQNDFDGRPRARYFGNRDSAANITMRHAVHRWSSASNVTGITLDSSVANALAVGSTISVYGLS